MRVNSLWRRRLLWSAGVIVTVGLVTVGGAGWYYSGLVIDPVHTPDYPLMVTAVTGDRVTLSGGADTAAPGTYGLAWADGNAVLGPVISAAAGTVTRTVVKVVRGDLRPGVQAYLDRSMWGHATPAAAGVPYTDVKIPSPLGDLPGWRTEGTSPTWVIAVHGRNGHPAEALRVLPVFHSLGMPVLGIAYRNDEGAPASPDGKLHLGATEWQDVADAVSYARAHGATGIVLYGWSMGGAIVPMTVRNLPDAPIKGMILDSPVLDWRSPIALGAEQMGVPHFMVSVGEWVVERRTGLSFDELDHLRHARDFKTPTLVFADDDDATVPVGPALEFARIRPDIVRLVRTSGGGHTGSWNVDPARYERELRAFASSL
ncbi:prolyl oligopeptidase family serine peptidase [Microbispora sp. RL4-1S]|uniref:Prolyl oligopeptidase family serine peptidase n=1 Tax=Microbispora oryzae TaxID=2806554 RepID=A0A940WMS7_9ACTN|nr:prolyl oligopeptidase family serine peptidase [Microbispora oryzae]MBP2704310.1 prolyl oligopeptidase family serine peptidase [Microbispora oryzae]